MAPPARVPVCRQPGVSLLLSWGWVLVQTRVQAFVPKCHEGDGNGKPVALLRAYPPQHACVGIWLGVRAHRSVCVCVQSTNMFSASSRRSNQSSPRNLSNSHPQKRLLPAGAAMSQQRQRWEAARPGAGLSLLQPGRLAGVTALAPMSQNTFLELASTGGSLS